MEHRSPNTKGSAKRLIRPKSAKARAAFDFAIEQKIRAGEVTASDAEEMGLPSTITWPAHRAFVYSRASSMSRIDFHTALKDRHGLSGPEIDAYYDAYGGKEHCKAVS